MTEEPMEITEDMIAIGKARMIEWLEFPTELGTAPDELEYLEAFEVEDGDGVGQVLAMRFRMHEPGDFAEWMVGIVGPLRPDDENGYRTWVTFSKFAAQDSAPLDELVDSILDTVLAIRDQQSSEPSE